MFVCIDNNSGQMVSTYLCYAVRASCGIKLPLRREKNCFRLAFIRSFCSGRFFVAPSSSRIEWLDSPVISHFLQPDTHTHTYYTRTLNGSSSSICPRVCPLMRQKSLLNPRPKPGQNLAYLLHSHFSLTWLNVHDINLLPRPPIFSMKRHAHTRRRTGTCCQVRNAVVLFSNFNLDSKGNTAIDSGYACSSPPVGRHIVIFLPFLPAASRAVFLPQSICLAVCLVQATTISGLERSIRVACSGRTKWRSRIIFLSFLRNASMIFFLFLELLFLTPV